MSAKKLIALSGATIAVFGLAPAAPLAAAGTTVTVRVEGAKKTLLPATPARTHGGWITKAGTPTGKCPASSAAGALDVATNHKWGGKYDKQFGLEITSVLGERHTFSSRYFWEIFVNNKPASVGACGQKLKPGDHLVFAASLVKKTEHPIGIRAPRQATVSHKFIVHVVYFNARGIAKPLAHATVSVHGKHVRTKANGIVGIKWGSPGTIVIRAARDGYIRAAPVSVHVSG